ncbi:FKBP-type peptidyl-prolyl cis-trans isomerase [Porphyromonas pogonae]|uniref:FKBP-type peptidyl-prolyl cis-trans isomerase n=1 Tax=Porphyromonas pogonae TaxID=867595 RepID=UPI002E7676A4|nr:FKBP-type peptidyl-prolyl cis-trans isomerase [Porphyromonas pogonae]
MSLRKKACIPFVGLLLTIGYSCSTLRNIDSKVVQMGAMTTKSDSVSYAFGVANADAFKKSLKEVPGNPLNERIIAQAFQDVFAGTPKISSNVADSMLRAYFTKAAAQKNSEYAEKNKQALVDNSRKPDVAVTTSGLQYRVLKIGQGPNVTVQDTVKVHYIGKTIDGNEFDNSYKRNEPVKFSVLKVIPGWTEGLCLMNKGAKYEFYIPANLAYGERTLKEIPANSTLIFEVELLDVYKGKAKPETQAPGAKGVDSLSKASTPLQSNKVSDLKNKKK